MNQIISKEDFDIFKKKIKKENKGYEVYSDDEYGNEYYPYNKSKKVIPNIKAYDFKMEIFNELNYLHNK